MSKRRPRESQEAGWEFLASELRDRRLAAGLTQEELGERVFVSGAYIGAFEAGWRKPSPELAAQFDATLETDGFFERLVRKLLEKSPFAAYFAKAAELEKLATKICEFAPTVIPGLLQTAAYAQAVTIATDPFATEEYVDEKVTSRIERARILKDAARPEYWGVLHENALRTPVGGPAAMAEQLEHIASMVRARQAIVTVIPYSEGAYPAMAGDLRLMEFAAAPPTAYTETSFSGTLLDEPSVVKKVRRAYDLLRNAALPPEASLALIESAAEEYRRCASTT
ncbi:helix-turn-helix transcriptional regulator [Streptomyces sp. NPDC101150]|uniref:helix-turn-helix domain-containing protein n=1 Tax=Streptomyces sp. NPDC101150 TaxID=3366114 RepID=UPI00380E2A31